MLEFQLLASLQQQNQASGEKQGLGASPILALGSFSEPRDGRSNTQGAEQDQLAGFKVTCSSSLSGHGGKSRRRDGGIFPAGSLPGTLPVPGCSATLQRASPPDAKQLSFVWLPRAAPLHSPRRLVGEIPRLSSSRQEAGAGAGPRGGSDAALGPSPTSPRVSRWRIKPCQQVRARGCGKRSAHQQVPRRGESGHHRYPGIPGILGAGWPRSRPTAVSQHEFLARSFLPLSLWEMSLIAPGLR